MTEYIVEPNPHPTVKRDGWTFRTDDWLIQKEEIVRCRDCVNFYDYCEWNSPDLEEPNGFCAWGKRKERGDE